MVAAAHDAAHLGTNRRNASCESADAKKTLLGSSVFGVSSTQGLTHVNAAVDRKISACGITAVV
jgi:hypothetical protein